MDEREDLGFEEFESALFDEGYQTDAETDTNDSDMTDTTEDPHEEDDFYEAEEEPVSEDSEEGESIDDAEENPAEGEEKADNPNEEQMFTLKVNKEEKKVTLEEMTAYAQKGADYDRVKEQSKQLQQSNAQLQEKLDAMEANQGVLDILSVVAEKSGSSLEQLAEALYINFRKSGGASEETAKEELKSARLEKELNLIKAQQAKQQDKESDADTRAQRDIEDFQKEYPEVTLTEELVNKLVPDIQKGMSLSAAYRKYEKAQYAEKIAELERKLSAKEQNAKNKRRSPGSQQDSGGRRSKSDFDEFEKALFG